MSARDIFGDQKESVTTYAVSLRVKGVMVGGIPSEQNVIRKWLEARMELDDVALEELLTETIADRDGPMTAAEKVDAIVKSPQAPSINGFKRDDDGVLCYEGRCMKAALKEAANSAYPGVDYPGKPKAKAKAKAGEVAEVSDATVSTRKGLMSTFVERVFVPEILISLDTKEPTRVEERIKHVMTPQGKKSAINLVEVVEQPVLHFTVRVHDDFLPVEAWAKIWERLEDIGIGSDRARSDGQFELLEFKKI